MSEINKVLTYQKVSDISILKTANTENKIEDEQNTILKIDVVKKIGRFEKCVCKIELSAENDTIKKTATGLFCHIPSKNLNVLITNRHVINKKYLEEENELKIYIEENENQEEKIINLQTKRLKYTDETLDATVIEILDEDLIDNYFEVDEELIKDNKFINETVFNYQFPLGKQLKVSFGKIIESKNEGTQFKYDVGTEFGSSGSPIILANGLKLIWIHRGHFITGNDNYENKQNVGIYLDKIIKRIPKITRPENTNIIKCLYDIQKEDVNKEIKIYDNRNNIEKDIKSVSIYRYNEKKRQINNGKCRFEKEGKYFIFYELNNSVNNLGNMFNNCSSLTRIYMPSFRDNTITNMSKMFKECISLKEIKFLPYFNSKNVKDISNMFSLCTSLEEINLSSFNTENVINMSGLFRECRSLTNINLSSFNTKKVEDMSSMFEGCSKLRKIDLSSFDTKKVEDMSNMFEECQQLKEINLSSFNTENTLNLSNMFNDCNSLQKLDLSNFDTTKVMTMKEMFNDCNSLKKINLSTFKVNDSSIIKGMFSACYLLEDIGNCNDIKILKEYELRKTKID